MNDILGEREAQHPFQWEDESRDSQDDRSVSFIIIVPSFKGLKTWPFNWGHHILRAWFNSIISLSGPHCSRPQWTTETTRATAWVWARLRLVIIIIIISVIIIALSGQSSETNLASEAGAEAEEDTWHLLHGGAHWPPRLPQLQPYQVREQIYP